MPLLHQGISSGERAGSSSPGGPLSSLSLAMLGCFLIHVISISNEQPGHSANMSDTVDSIIAPYTPCYNAFDRTKPFHQYKIDSYTAAQDNSSIAASISHIDPMPIDTQLIMYYKIAA